MQKFLVSLRGRHLRLKISRGGDRIKMPGGHLWGIGKRLAREGHPENKISRLIWLFLLVSFSCIAIRDHLHPLCTNRSCLKFGCTKLDRDETRNPSTYFQFRQEWDGKLIWNISASNCWYVLCEEENGDIFERRRRRNLKFISAGITSSI